ncbi:hypothetical protein WJX82_000884 [Trebouxia sp. C0006]
MDSSGQTPVQQSYITLFQSLQHTANAKYFSGLYEKPANLEQQGVSAVTNNPLKTFLTTPKLSEEYAQAQLPPEQQTVKTDYDVLKEQYRFVRTAEDDSNDSWDVCMARRYYAKLFKEYAVADLSRYRESKVGLRWRTEREVVIGKGQFECGAKGCDERRALASYEVNFAYKEAGEHKQALVKVRELQKQQTEHNKRQKHSQKASGSKSDHSSTSHDSLESHGAWKTGRQDTHGKTSGVDKLFEGLFD